MKRIRYSLLVVFHIGLLATFILNQFGIGPAWIGTALAAHPQAETEDEEWDRQRPPGMRDADWDKTTGFVEATREPGAIGLEEWERLLAFLEEHPEGVDEADWDIIRLYFFDRGPTVIDVSDYPEDMRKRYEVFLDRCSQCHGIARAVNAYGT